MWLSYFLSFSIYLNRKSKSGCQSYSLSGGLFNQAVNYLSRGGAKYLIARKIRGTKLQCKPFEEGAGLSLELQFLSTDI